MAHAVGIDFRGVYLCRMAQALHHAPDITAIQRFSAAASEDWAALDFFLFCIFFQQFLQLTRVQDAAHFSFVMNFGHAKAQALHGNMTQFADTDAGAAQGLDETG